LVQTISMGNIYTMITTPVGAQSTSCNYTEIDLSDIRNTDESCFNSTYPFYGSQSCIEIDRFGKRCYAPVEVNQHYCQKCLLIQESLSDADYERQQVSLV
jgi:hypothetical protein